MLVPLRQKGYVRHIPMLHCSLDCDVTMLVTLQKQRYARHIVTT
jgi:hypothetical protein